jgi:hypothetical protein
MAMSVPLLSVRHISAERKCSGSRLRDLHHFSQNDAYLVRNIFCIY